ncbi:MAG TPA: GrpB family protein [Bryobacteraceae bacterium]|nr:GrpB family protein [Bryobacteraceae bacterium]
MSDTTQPPPLTDAQIRNRTIGELRPLSDKILIVDSDPHWPELFEREAARIRDSLGARAQRIEHVGSTSVPGLAAKPIIDIVLGVADPAHELNYVPDLERAGYVLRIREIEWHQHRMLKRPGAAVHLHLFAAGCSEIDRMLLFRNWLRSHPADRDLYERTKRVLAEQEWKHAQNYADAKTAVVEEILGRARRG